MAKRLTWVLVLALVSSAWSSTRADSIYGECVYKDGSKAGGSVGISTSWNGKKAYPVNGRYVLDFGQTLNTSITIYVNGKTFGRVKVSKQTRVDITVP